VRKKSRYHLSACPHIRTTRILRPAKLFSSSQHTHKSAFGVSTRSTWLAPFICELGAEESNTRGSLSQKGFCGDFVLTFFKLHFTCSSSQSHQYNIAAARTGSFIQLSKVCVYILCADSAARGSLALRMQSRENTPLNGSCHQLD
jgi:hypothetical protein